jgi:hypothetical protein
MMDMDDGYILWTGIWKALGNHKGEYRSAPFVLIFFLCILAHLADIVKMLESQPDLAAQLRRVRGGYLKIQGQLLNIPSQRTAS